MKIALIFISEREKHSKTFKFLSFLSIPYLILFHFCDIKPIPLILFWVTPLWFSALRILECLRFLNMSSQGNHNCKQQPSLVALDIQFCFLPPASILYCSLPRSLSLSLIFVQSSLSLRYVCVCVLNVLLLGQQHSENSLGEWVEFTGGQRFL